MVKKILWIVACVIVLCGLFACGAVEQNKAAAPLAQDMGQVRTALTPLPEELESVTLLAHTASIMLSASRDGTKAIYEYSPSSGAYRHMESPVEGTITAMAASPDGSLWTAIQGEGSGVLLKSNQGNVLLRQDLEGFIPETILCDSIGHVFAASKNTVHRYSPEGLLQGTLTLPDQNEIAELQMAARQDSIFLRIRRTGEGSTYTELLSDMSLGDSFDACLTSWHVKPIGSFLRDYLVIEADSMGLYAYREGSGWETVCLWSAQHLDGTVGTWLLSDAQGAGVLQYEKNGHIYCLNLSPA